MGWFVTLVVWLSVTAWPPGHAGESSNGRFRIAFSASMFTDVNENDAKAAVKAWGQTLAREKGIPTDMDPQIFKDAPAILPALQNNQVDALAITTLEFDALRRDVSFAHIFVTYNTSKTMEEYLLLTHQNSGIGNVADLPGCSLVLHQNPRTCLAPLWLDTLLVQQGFKPAAGLFGKITAETKLSKVVLPAFFRQSDACIVTRSGFEMMKELNPQVGRQLKILASSAAVVPAVLCFRADYQSAFKDQLVTGIGELHLTPSGQQVLTIFHSEKIEEQPASCLDSALELIAAHERTVGGTNRPSTAGVKALADAGNGGGK